MGFTDWLFGSDDWDGGVDSSSTNGNNKYNMQYLRSQLAILHSTPVLNTESRYRIMSALQEITELLIWDDQHYDNDNDGGDGGNGSHNLQRSKNNSKDSFFDVFMEQGLAAYVLDLLKTFARERRQDPSAAALMGRLLRMLNILIENLRHDTSMYYLLSNNFLNEVIIWGSVLREDVSGGECEEAVAYYVTLLKTLSLKLNQSTLNFFLDESQSNWARAFPLYSFTLPFIFHPSESMIRIAARTAMLSIYRLDSAACRRYLLDEERSGLINFWSRFLESLVGQCCHSIDLQLKDIVGRERRASGSGGQHFPIRLIDELEEFQGLMLFLADVFALHHFPDAVNTVMELLVRRLVVAILLESAVNGGCNNSVDPISPSQQRLLQPSTALLLLYHIVRTVRHPKLSEIILRLICNRRSLSPNQLHREFSGESASEKRPITASASLDDLIGKDQPADNPYMLFLCSQLRSGPMSVRIILGSVLLALISSTDFIMDRQSIKDIIYCDTGVQVNLLPATEKFYSRIVGGILDEELANEAQEELLRSIDTMMNDGFVSFDGDTIFLMTQ